ncbi:MAG: two pore domain potassium channel family protein [Flavobacteriales bacterium]|nr:two pore domain potassium channel family protein [Flavobacteriales bacterium]
MSVVQTLVSFFKDKEYRELILVCLFVVISGSVFYHFVEGWGWVDSVYFSVVTLTTVGFGDLAPQTDMGKIFTIFYILVGIGIILGFVEAVYHHFNPRKKN